MSKQCENELTHTGAYDTPTATAAGCAAGGHRRGSDTVLIIWACDGWSGGSHLLEERPHSQPAALHPQNSQLPAPGHIPVWERALSQGSVMKSSRGVEGDKEGGERREKGNDRSANVVKSNRSRG